MAMARVSAMSSSIWWMWKPGEVTLSSGSALQAAHFTAETGGRRSHPSKSHFWCASLGFQNASQLSFMTLHTASCLCYACSIQNGCFPWVFKHFRALGLFYFLVNLHSLFKTAYMFAFLKVLKKPFLCKVSLVHMA